MTRTPWSPQLVHRVRSPRTRHGSVAGRGSATATDSRQQSDADPNQHKRTSLDTLRELHG